MRPDGKYFRSFRDLDPLLKQEREAIFYSTGRNLGYDPEGAREFANYVKYVNEMTSAGSLLQNAWTSARDSVNEKGESAE